MKKLILILSIATLLVGCASEPKREINGDVEEVTESQYYASEKFGEPTAGRLQRMYKWKYNNEDEVSQWASYYNDHELLLMQKFEYNDDGKLISIKRYDAGGGLEGVIIYKYNNNGKRAKRESYDKNDELEEVDKYEYNSRGKLIKQEGTHYERGSYKSEYNNEENIVKQESYDKDGDIERIVKWEYNNEECVVKVEVCNKFEEPEYIQTYQYVEFDDNDNWVERIEYRDDKVEYITKREITYR